MSFILSPNMSLSIPTVGQEPDPNWALDINTSLSLIDQHDHSLGRGVQITPAGLNINATVNLQNNSLSNTLGIQFTSAANAALQTLYVKPGSESPAINDLWFNDGSGTPVQITSGGILGPIEASAIPGQSYAAGTFIWKQGSGSTTPADFDIGSITLRPHTPLTTNGVVLSPPSGINSLYPIALPPLPVGSPGFVTMDTSGTQSTVPLPLAGSNIAAGTITEANITPATITTASISATAGILGSQLAAAAAITPAQNDSSGFTINANVSSYSGTSTNLIQTITGLAGLTASFFNPLRPTFVSFTAFNIVVGTPSSILVSGSDVTFLVRSRTTMAAIVESAIVLQPGTYPVSILNTILPIQTHGSPAGGIIDVGYYGTGGTVVLTNVALFVVQV